MSNKMILGAFVIVMGYSPLSLAICKGKMINPITDINWNYIYPFKLLSGVKVGPGRNVLLHREPAVLKCPHQVYPGVGVTFFSPDFLGEVTQDPMCILSLPKVKLTKYFDRNHGDSENNEDGTSASYSHVHLFEFDVMKLLKFFKTFVGCLDTTTEITQSPGGIAFGVKWLSEVDPTHANTMWNIAFAPETVLFTTPIALMTCIPDTLSATFLDQPLTPLFWCQGQDGSLYPFDGHSSGNNGQTLNNMSIMQKNLAKGSRMFILPSTIGPWAQCMTIPLGVITKSQYYFDPTFPRARRSGKKIYFGNLAEEWSLGRPYNFPTFGVGSASQTPSSSGSSTTSTSTTNTTQTNGSAGTSSTTSTTTTGGGEKSVPGNGGDSAYVIWRARQCSIGK